MENEKEGGAEIETQVESDDGAKWRRRSNADRVVCPILFVWCRPAKHAHSMLNEPATISLTSSVPDHKPDQWSTNQHDCGCIPDHKPLQWIEVRRTNKRINNKISLRHSKNIPISCSFPPKIVPKWFQAIASRLKIDSTRWNAAWLAETIFRIRVRGDMF